MGKVYLPSRKPENIKKFQSAYFVGTLSIMADGECKLELWMGRASNLPAGLGQAALSNKLHWAGPNIRTGQAWKFRPVQK